MRGGGGGGWGSCGEGRVTGRKSCHVKTQSEHLGNCTHFSLTGAEAVGMVRGEAGEVAWNQAVQDSYVVLKVMKVVERPYGEEWLAYSSILERSLISLMMSG